MNATDTRTRASELHTDAIPDELRALPQWVTWRYERRGDKRTKVPMDPHTNRNASVSEAATWGTFDEALTALEWFWPDGIGFVLTEGDPFYFVDLDACFDLDRLQPWAAEIVEQLPDCYWERSPSGAGLHGIGRGTPPRWGNKRLGVEIYDRARFATMTGHTWDLHDRIGPDSTEAITRVHRAVFGEEPTRRPTATPQTSTRSDDEVLALAMTADRFRRLMGGDTSGYGGDDSRADAAILEHLLWWNGGDIAQACRIARTSGLNRPKWDEPRPEASGYLEYSARRILARMDDFYSPAVVPTMPEIHSKSGTGALSERILRFRTAREIGEITPESPDWIVPGLLAVGSVTELTGKAKSSGKTTFVTHLCRAVLTGGRFLGWQTAQSAIVYLSEQSPASLREALRRADLLSRDDLHVLSWAETVDFTWEDVAAAAVDAARECGARVLIVDTLPQYAGLRGDDENSAGAALRAVQPLQAAAAAGIAVLAVRHDRKTGGVVGESGRGSSAYAGAVDILLQLAPYGENRQPACRVLSGLSRYDETPDQLTIELTEDGYVSHGDGSAIKTAEARAAILAALPESEGDAMRADELAKAAGVSATLTRQILTGLLGERKVAKTGTGVKGKPYRFWAGTGDSIHSKSLVFDPLFESISKDDHGPTCRAESSSQGDDSGAIHSKSASNLRLFESKNGPPSERGCLGCGQPLPPGRMHYCAPCLTAQEESL